MEARFWSKVDASGDCWGWTAARTSNGYGYYKFDGRMVRAHRHAWETLVGPIPDGLQIDHLCRYKVCVNPDHLRVVDNRANQLAGYRSPTARNARKTHCANGHLLSGSNLVIQVSPQYARLCRACRGWDEMQRSKRARALRCVNGHAISSENTYYRPDNGARQCRACRRVRQRRYSATRSRAGLGIA